MIGTTLSQRFEILAEIGRGGRGVVYRARDAVLRREVAVKVLPMEDLSAETEERFQREAHIVAQLDHPAIVSVYDFGRHGGSLFIVMPFVQGKNLRAFLNAGLLSLGDTLDIAIQVADALEYSHSRDVVHRDIKPENIMLSRDTGAELRVRILDFGLAKAAAAGQRLTKTGAIVGTVQYLSPDQITAGSVDRRTDIYSLGTVLYECLAGVPPFSGSTEAVLYRIVHEEPRSVRAAGGDVEAELDDLTLRCLAKQPGRRPSRAGDLAEQLRRYRGKLKEDDRSRVTTSESGRPRSARPAASPFVGREREFVELQEKLHLSLGGECQVVAIGGEAGVGKTRLLQELEKLAKALRVKVLRGRFAEQDQAFAYQGFCDLVQEHFRARDPLEPLDLSDLAPDLVSFFPALGEVREIRAAAAGGSGNHPSVAAGTGSFGAAALRPNGPGAPSPARRVEDRTFVFELFARTISRLSGGEPLLVVLENLHQANASVEAVQYLSRRLGPTPTLIVASYRQTEIDRSHPMQRLIDGLADDPRFSSIVLRPLTPSAHRELVQSLLGGSSLSEELARSVFEATEGNPLFTKELVRSLSDSGGIARDVSDIWTLSGTGISSDALPATIQQAVERRIQRLPEDLRDVLSTAAVLGRTFETRTLEALLEGRSGVDEVIDRLLEEGLIEEEREGRGGDRLTFASVLVRDVLYTALPRRKRRSVHRRVAELVEKRHAGRLERVYPQLVYHFTQADVPEKAVEYALATARKALQSFSAEDALRAGKTALDFLVDEERALDPGLEAETRLLLASAYRMQGDIDGALSEAESALRLLERDGRTDRALPTLLALAEIAWDGRRSEEARRFVERGLALSRASSETAVRAKLLSLGATVATLRGDHRAAGEQLEELDRLNARASSDGALEVPRGGRLTVAFSNRVQAREPTETNLVEEEEVLANVFEPLLATDAEGHLIPWLCESWDLREGGASFALTIRRGVRFQDGASLTAHDVKRSFERSVRRRPDKLAAALSVIAGVREMAAGEAAEIAGVVVTTDDTLEIRLVEPLPIFPALLSHRRMSIVRGDAEGTAVGTGPFRIAGAAASSGSATSRPDGPGLGAAAAAAETLLLERNPGYWKGAPPPLDALEARSPLPASEIAAGFRRGEIDLARDLLPRDLEELLRRGGAELIEAPKKNTYFVLFNVHEEVPSEAVRRAMAGMVRPHDLVRRALGRFGQPATGILPPGILGHDPGRRLRLLSREKALELLRGAGLAAAPLSPLPLSAAVHPLIQDRYSALLTALLAVWQDLGVTVSIATPTMESFLASRTESAGISLWIGRWNADYDDPDNFTYGLFHSRDGMFRAYYASPEGDDVLERARAETRPAAREALYRRFEGMLLDPGILVPLFHEVDYRLGSSRLRGLCLRSTPPYVNYGELGKQASPDEKTDAEPGAGRGNDACRGVLHVPIPGDIEGLDPARVATVEQAEVLPNLFETLTRELDGRLVPWLASRYVAEEGGRRYRFWLRDEVRFHDGRRLTSRDVRFSFERLLADGNANARWLLSPIRGAADIQSGERAHLEGFQIVSSSELTIDLESPVPFFPALLSDPATAILPEGCEPTAGTWRDGTVGTGPFRVAAFERGKLLSLERAPAYWREGLPKAESLVFHFGLTPHEILKEFREGRLSIASNLPPAAVESLRKDAALAAGYREKPLLSTYFLALNANRGPLADAALRRRLREAVDIPSLVRRSLGRLALPAVGLIPPGLLGASDTGSRSRGRPRPPSTEEALRSSTAAAIRPGGPGEGALGAAAAHPRVGNQDEVELTVAVNPVFLETFATFWTELCDAFLARGIRLDVLNKSRAEADGIQAVAGSDVAADRWFADYPDADTFAHGVLHTRTGTVGAYAGTPELDRLIEEGRTEMDPAVRHPIYRRVEETLERNALLLPLFHEQVYRFVRPEVEGLSITFFARTVSYEDLRLKA